MGLRQGLRDAVAAAPPTAPDPALGAVKTWRYLRLAMVLLVVGVGVSVVYEHLRTPAGCWQHSISAYYYTPAQGFLVGTLVTIGVCLVALEGNTDWEDVLLNLAGVCAPFAAFVPVPDAGSCGAIELDPAQRDLNVANNVLALLVVVGLALALQIGLTTAAHVRDRNLPGRVALGALGLSVILFVATTLVFGAAREWFITYGHYIAAVAMFVFIVLDVCVTAWDFAATRRRTGRPAGRRNPYAVVAVLMVGTTVVHGALRLAGWDLWLLSLEASLIALFAVFWLLQTVELWNQGLRRDSGLATVARAGS